MFFVLSGKQIINLQHIVSVTFFNTEQKAIISFLGGGSVTISDPQDYDGFMEAIAGLLVKGSSLVGSPRKDFTPF